jgi:hypothetical protein
MEIPSSQHPLSRLFRFSRCRGRGDVCGHSASQANTAFCRSCTSLALKIFRVNFRSRRSAMRKRRDNPSAMHSSRTCLEKLDILQY